MSHFIVHVPPSHVIVAAVWQLHRNLCLAELGIFNLSGSQVTGIVEWASKIGNQFFNSCFTEISDGYIHS